MVGAISESRRSGIGIPSYRAVGIGKSLRIATVGNRNSLLPRCRDREISPNRDGRESEFPPTALSGSGNLSESRRSGIGIPSYRAVGIGKSLRIATVGNRNSLLPRCRDREISPNRDGRESEFPPTSAVGIGKSLRIATVGNRSSLLPRCRDREISPNRDGRESEFPPTALSGSGRSLGIATVGNWNSLLPALSGSGNLSESRRSGIGIPSYQRCRDRKISPNRDGRESEFPPTALSGSEDLSESRRSGIGIPSYQRCRDREIPPTTQSISKSTFSAWREMCPPAKSRNKSRWKPSARTGLDRPSRRRCLGSDRCQLLVRRDSAPVSVALER